MIEKIVLSDYLKRLDNIIQWQEIDVFNKESVSQHSFKVSVFTRIIVEELFLNEHQDDDYELAYTISSFKLAAVTHAIFHDWDEAIFLRDVSHSVKYNKHNGQDVRKTIDDYVKFEFDKEFDDSDVCKNLLYHSIIDVNTSVKKVVKVADWLALFFFCRRELALGNKSFEDTYNYCRQGIVKSAMDMIEEMKSKFGISCESVYNAIIHNVIFSK